MDQLVPANLVPVSKFDVINAEKSFVVFAKFIDAVRVNGLIHKNETTHKNV